MSVDSGADHQVELAGLDHGFHLAVPEPEIRGAEPELDSLARKAFHVPRFFPQMRGRPRACNPKGTQIRQLGGAEQAGASFPPVVLTFERPLVRLCAPSACHPMPGRPLRSYCVAPKR